VAREKKKGSKSSPTNGYLGAAKERERVIRK